MFRLLTITLSLAGLIVASACTSRSGAGTSDTSADVAAIDALAAREIAAFTSFDYAALDTIFTPDIVLMPPGEPTVSGLEAVTKWTQTIAEQVTATGEYTSSDVSVAGDWAVQRFTGKLTFTPKAGGQPMTEIVKGLHVLRRQSDGSWRIAQDVWNSDAPAAGAASGATIAGTWELNVAKSTFSPGPPPKLWVRTYEVVGDEERAIQYVQDADGAARLIQFTVRYDGKDYPYAGSEDWNSVAVTRVDDRTTSHVQKKDGQVRISGTRVISPDGRTLTVSAKGTNASGQAIDQVLVFERR